MRKPVYVPPSRPRRPNLWVALAEFATLILMWGTITAAAIFLRALMEAS